MEIVFNQLNWLLILIAIYTAVVGAIGGLLFKKIFTFKKRTEKRVEKLEATISVLASGALGMGKKMLVLEDKLLQLKISQDELQNSNMDFSYTQAQRLISEGVANEAIAANSGLSATEINLMRLLHSRSPKIA